MIYNIFRDVKDWIEAGLPWDSLINGDCQKAMEAMKNNFADIAIIDPPYGINRDGGETGKYWKWFKPKEWDSKKPERRYWEQMFQTSKNQIIFGANYFVEYLLPSMGWVYWDKGQKLTMSDGEFIYTSFNRASRSILMKRCEISKNGGTIHPTQKPVALYRLLMKNYIKSGEKILDTHLGSGSSAIAAWQEGHPFVGIELDGEYFEEMIKRVQSELSQIDLFPSK